MMSVLGPEPRTADFTQIQILPFLTVTEKLNMLDIKFMLSTKTISSENWRFTWPSKNSLLPGSILYSKAVRS